jgi:hypothetical protein
MAGSRQTEYDALTRTRRLLAADHSESGVVLAVSEQAIGDRLDLNKALYTDPASGWGEGRRVASIPNLVWEELVRNGTAQDNKKLKAWLNDPDNRAFRTRPGKV